jgi:hypothetical protein
MHGQSLPISSASWADLHHPLCTCNSVSRATCGISPLSVHLAMSHTWNMHLCSDDVPRSTWPMATLSCVSDFLHACPHLAVGPVERTCPGAVHLPLLLPSGIHLYPSLLEGCGAERQSREGEVWEIRYS